MYNNIEKGTKLILKDLIDYQPDQTLNTVLVKNEKLGVYLVSFDKGRGLTTHTTEGDVMATVLDGTGEFTVDKDAFILKEGETIVMPKDIPHSVFAVEKLKMMLTISF